MVFFKDQEMTDKINNDLFATHESLPEQLPDNGSVTDNSTTLSVKNLSNTPINSNTSDVSLTENTLNVNSVDR